MRRSLAIAAYLGLSLYLGPAAVVHADSWRLEELPAPPPGWIGVSPQAINSTGTIVGTYRLQSDTLGVSRMFIFDGASWTTLPTLGGANGQARGVNDRGQVVGWSETDRIIECFPAPNGSEFCLYEGHAFVWRDGTMHDLGQNGFDSMAIGINNLGWTVGFGTPGFALRWSPKGTVEQFGTFDGCFGSIADSINSRGQIVGSGDFGSGQQAFLWHELTGPRLLGTLGGQFSIATAISESGHVVGHSETLTVTVCTTQEFGAFCEHEQHPFLWQDGQMSDLGTLGGPNAMATAVNSDGVVVGTSETSEKLSCFIEGSTERCLYRFHAFVWSDGQMIDLGQPGLDSFAAGINAKGIIVGTARRDQRTSRPVIWRRQ